MAGELTREKCRFSPSRLVSVVLLLCVAAGLPASSQEKKFDRGLAKRMLHDVENDLKQNYYDPSFHGVDITARFKEAEDKINHAPSMNYALADIAAALDALNDSHTFFTPPPRPYVHSYGIRIQAIGNTDCFVTAVRPGGDAAQKGVRPGDQVISVNGYGATRQNLWKINYLYGALRPQPGLRLVLRSPEGNERQVDVSAQVRETKRIVDWSDLFGMLLQPQLQRRGFVEYGNKAIVYKLSSFMINPREGEEILDRIRTHDAVILDLRDNPGGYVDAMKELLSGFFDQKVKVADRQGRRNLKPEFTKPRPHQTFNGKLIVLVNSGSASAAEVFARVVQLEKRGTVVGDRSSGSVMESRHYPHVSGAIVLDAYGSSITEADMIMSDGKSLEHVGVMPDERLIPMPSDLAAGRDPVLARAAELIALRLTPEDAGKLFPIEWSKEMDKD